MGMIEKNSTDDSAAIDEPISADASGENDSNNSISADSSLASSSSTASSSSSSTITTTTTSSSISSSSSFPSSVAVANSSTSSNITDSSKVIFLDVDGVLNSSLTFGHQCPLEDIPLELLSGIIQRTGALIVMSSTWRLRKEMRDILQSRCEAKGIPKSTFVGATPEIKVKNVPELGNSGRIDYGKTAVASRCEEIRYFVEEHSFAARNIRWIVLDDMDMSSDAEIGPKLVLTKRSGGLNETEAERALEMLLA